MIDVNKMIVLAESVIETLERDLGLNSVEVAGVVAMTGSILVQRHPNQATSIDALGCAVAEGVHIYEEVKKEQANDPMADFLTSIGLDPSDFEPKPEGDEVKAAFVDANGNLSPLSGSLSDILAKLLKRG